MQKFSKWWKIVSKDAEILKSLQKDAKSFDLIIKRCRVFQKYMQNINHIHTNFILKKVKINNS